MLIRLNSFDIDDVSICLATKSHLHEICKMNRAEYWVSIEGISDDELFRLGKWWVKPDLLEWHYRILQKCGGNIILAIYQDKIIGHLDYAESVDFDTKPSKRVHIIWLLVDQSYRRLGIANLLIQKLKRMYENMEIWVEPEDERSLDLYSKLGIRKKFIDNWRLLEKDFKKKTLAQHDIREIGQISYRQLLEKLENFELKLIIGKYYAPAFDLMQLSEGEPVHRYLWGEMDRARIIGFSYNNLTVYAIETQFLRLYSNTDKFKLHDFEILLSLIIARILGFGFGEIYVQIYNDNYLKKILSKLQFRIVEESYPIFSL